MRGSKRIIGAAIIAVAATTAALAAVVPSSAEQAETATAADLLSALVIDHGVPPSAPAASARTLDADGDGCDTTAEVLQRDSTVAVVRGTGCSVRTGRWVSPWDGSVLTAASDVEVVPSVPFAEAMTSGGEAWSAASRLAFANDLGAPGSLVAVSHAAASARGAKDPSAWLPTSATARCGYATAWVSTKFRWDLTITPSEESALSAVLTGTCGDAVVPVPDEARITLDPAFVDGDPGIPVPLGPCPASATPSSPGILTPLYQEADSDAWRLNDDGTTCTLAELSITGN